MKKLFITIVAITAFGSLNAQEKDKFRCGLDFGYVPASGGLGISLALEPKYNIAENMNVGLRMSGAGIIKDIVTYGNTNSGKVSAISSYTGTYDYYFPDGSSFTPYVGGGIGFSSVLNIAMSDISQKQPTNLSTETMVNGMIRGGFEWAGFRMGLEYNMLPQSKLVDFNGLNLGDVSNSYFGVNIGFFVGGGKWGK